MLILIERFYYFRLQDLRATEHLQPNSQRVVITEGLKLLLLLIRDIKGTLGTVILPVPSPKQPKLKRRD